MAHHVFPGNTADINAFRAAFGDLGRRFPIRRVVIVADRGVVSEEMIEDLEQANRKEPNKKIDYIFGMRLRKCREGNEQVLSRAGRYYRVADNPEAKEVSVNGHWKMPGDSALVKEYNKCHFTVYPSLEEGYGLPILESLWYGKPCICRNYGAMAEAAEGGGCLMVDTTDAGKLAEAILLLSEDKRLRARLGEEAVSRHLKTWAEYAGEILQHLADRPAG